MAEKASSLLLVALIFVQLITLGANTSLLSAIAALADVLVALIILLLLRLPDAVWKGLASVLFPLALALCWAGLPEIAGPQLLVAPNLVPELFALEWEKLLGIFACLLSGIILGARPLVTRWFVDCFLAGGFAWTLLALLLRQADPWHVWGHTKGLLEGRFTATLLNTNAAGCAFGVIAIVATGRLQIAIGRLSARGWSESVAASVAACGTVVVVALAACALTQSRASLILTVLAMAIILFRWARPLRRRGALGRGAWIAALVLPLLGIALLFGTQVWERFGSIGGDATDRLVAMLHFGGIAVQSPWFGYGLGSFSTVNARHLDPRTVGLLWNFGAAHSAPIHAALEAGIPFTALIVLAIAIALRRMASIRHLDVADPLMLANFAAVALVFVASLVDIEFSIPALASLTAVLSGLVLGRAERAIASRQSSID
jgi:O-antigen ligase